MSGISYYTILLHLVCLTFMCEQDTEIQNPSDSLRFQSYKKDKRDLTLYGSVSKSERNPQKGKE